MSTLPHDEPLAAVRDSLASAHRAAEAAIRHAESAESRYAAFAAASELAVVFREVADQVAGFRAREAARIRDAEGLSLAGLAKRLGVSKPRAQQLIKMAEAQNSPAKSGD